MNKRRMPDFTQRRAEPGDILAIRGLMARAIDLLQQRFLTAEQIVASRAVMGLDTQLIDDRSYFLVESAGRLAGCGGWSARATLYGGDHSTARDSGLLDPARDPARIRAMYTDPEFVRRGVGALLLSLCEAAAREAGFARAELMATLSGEPLYRRAGYSEIERITDNGVPLIRMGKPLA